MPPSLVTFTLLRGGPTSADDEWFTKKFGNGDRKAGTAPQARQRRCATWENVLDGSPHVPESPHSFHSSTSCASLRTPRGG